MADQAPIKAQRISTLKSGERVILDPGVTTQNIMLVSEISLPSGIHSLSTPSSITGVSTLALFSN
jgi:hypothetical protein